MQHAIFRKILAVLFGLVLAAIGLWASAAGEDEPAAAMEKEMVMDPTIGKTVTAPEYGGTLTYALGLKSRRGYSPIFQWTRSRQAHKRCQ